MCSYKVKEVQNIVSVLPLLSSNFWNCDLRIWLDKALVYFQQDMEVLHLNLIKDEDVFSSPFLTFLQPQI